jgi:hypothetical protein
VARHTWTNALDVPATMLLTFVPGGMKALFDEATPLMRGQPLDMEALTAVKARHATTVVGPPPRPGPLTGGQPS